MSVITYLSVSVSRDHNDPDQTDKLNANDSAVLGNAPSDERSEGPYLSFVTLKDITQKRGSG